MSSFGSLIKPCVCGRSVNSSEKKRLFHLQGCVLTSSTPGYFLTLNSECRNSLLQNLSVQLTIYILYIGIILIS